MNKQLNTEFRITNCGDQWGNAMNWWFTIADYLTSHSDVELPSEWEYQPSILGESNDQDDYVTQVCNDYPADDLLDFGNVLYRYARILESKGLSY